MRSWIHLFCVLCLLAFSGLAFSRAMAEKDTEKPAEVDFSRQIRPILAKHCYSCHGSDTKEAGVALNDFESAIRESDSGVKPIVPGSSSESELMRRITSSDPSERMPPEGDGLTEKQVDLLKQWIQSGAEYKEHWAFLPLSDPKPPVSGSVSTNPIDAFVKEKWQTFGLKPAERASPRSLIRRLYFDCLGVPPDLETVERFAADPSELAYQELVDDLLADPRMGERMARDWLDVVRYAETNSYERDGPKPNAWKYRDYVVQSLNQDKPYNQFLAEQIAGDEMQNPSQESLTATGFFRLGIWDDEPADKEKATFDEYDDHVTTIGQGILGLTLNCARCHDHKIDPIPQKDYYQMVAFIRDVPSYGTRGDERSNNQIDVSDPVLKSKNSQLKAKIKSLLEASRGIEEAGIAKMTEEDKQAAKSPDRDKVIRERLKNHVSPSQWEEYETMKKTIEVTRKELEDLPLDFRLGLAKAVPQPEQTFVLMRGTPGALGDAVEPGFPKLFQESDPLTVVPTANSAGRRTQLVRWMTMPENRLTSRVIVNRVWQHHFGRGIVRSANNFGQLGDPPTHPELLDFLARQLVQFDWQLKPLHRMMLLSETYRLSSGGDEDSVQKDPNNDYFSRFNVRRLSAEELRDAVLTANNRINWQQLGPSFFPEVSDDVKAGQSIPGKGWGNSSEAEKARRSIYIHIKRSLIPPELSVFDFPETDTSCEARFLTTQAAQAMNMLNGAFMQKQSSFLAENASRNAKDLGSRLRAAIEFAYSRPANESEIQRGKDRIGTFQSKFGLDENQAFQKYCLVLLNSNEFLYLD